MPQNQTLPHLIYTLSAATRFHALLSTFLIRPASFKSHLISSSCCLYGFSLQLKRFQAMRSSIEETPSRCGQVIDLVAAVKELHRLTPQELEKSLKDSEDFTLKHTTEGGHTIKISLERLAQLLPVHLISKLVASHRDEDLFKYMLCGGRLMHTLFDLATRHSRLEQILLDDLKVSEQLTDLVFYTITVLSNRLEYQDYGSLALVLSALATCYLYLLPQILSSHWHELAQILVAHPKVDKFMDVAFRVVSCDVRSLQRNLSSDFHVLSASSTKEQSVNYLSQQCEASLQLLASLCHQKHFRERILKNKDVCRESILQLARMILNLKFGSFLECAAVVAAVSRLKSKIISILLQLCEVESPSYLDEIASYPKSLKVAKDIALEVLEILREAFTRDLKPSDSSEKPYPTGLLQPNALRLVDMLSDDSNFRSYVAINFPEVLTAVVSYPHGEFLSTWCSSVPPSGEEDVSLEFDAFAAAGWILDSFSSLGLLNATYSESNFIQNSLPQASHAHYKTSLLVKIIANLHFFGPEVCKANEKNLFFNKFYESLFKDEPKASPSYAQKAGTVHKNLRSLLAHAESLVPSFVNEDDIQLFRAFFDQLRTLNPPYEFEARPEERKFGSISSWDKFPKLDVINHLKEAQGNGNQIVLAQDLGLDDRKEQHSDNAPTLAEKDQNFLLLVDVCPTDESSESDSSTTRGRNCAYQSDNNELPKTCDRFTASGSGLQDSGNVRTIRSEENRPRKRKRSVMNERQISLIEKALLDEPDMQRKAASIQSWADKLCAYGSEVTSSQLKNWLNNRKARLARAAAKDVRVGPDGEISFPEKQGGSASGLYDSPESPADGINGSSSASMRSSKLPKIFVESSPPQGNMVAGHHCAWELGNGVSLINELGEEIGKGKIHQLQGEWFGRKLLESCTCIVDITELVGAVSKDSRVPFPSDITGVTFEETVKKLGAMCVVWDISKLRAAPSATTSNRQRG